MIRITLSLTVACLLALCLPLMGNGFIIIDPPPRPLPMPVPAPFPMEIVHQHISVEIDDDAAITRVDQSFHNPTGRRLQGYYVFPVPHQAVLESFSMFVDNEELHAELLDAGKAQEIFEEIVRRMRDPALLEYTGQSIVRVRIFPMEPGSERRIKLAYRQLLSRDSGTIEYVYPFGSQGFSSKPIKEFSVAVAIRSSLELGNIYSPTHDIEVVRSERNRASLSMEASGMLPHGDFRLYFDGKGETPALSLLTFRDGGEDGYFYLSLNNGAATNHTEIMAKDITFVLDVSGSMAGEKLEQAGRALRYCVDNLRAGDRFEIIRFSTEANALFGELRSAADDQKRKAHVFVDGLSAVGGTNIGHALELALNAEAAPGRPHFIVFITDGKPTVGELDEASLLDLIRGRNHGNRRIFTFGIGAELNTHLLDKITELTGAYRTYIHPDEDIEVKISSFYRKIASPVMTDISIRVDGPVRHERVYPPALPNLFDGGSLVVLGRYRGHGTATVTVSGSLNGEPSTLRYPLTYAEKSTRYDFVPPLWAARAVGHLLDQLRLSGETEELKAEIVHLARAYGIMTPYTSFLIVEDEERRVTGDFRTREPHDLGGAEAVRERRRAFLHSEGASGVRSSEEVQVLQQAPSLSKTMPGGKRSSSFLPSHETGESIPQVRLIGGRAIYLVNDIWIDSRLQASNLATLHRIAFGSEEYLRFWKEHQDLSTLLALGSKLRFVHAGVAYEIH